MKITAFLLVAALASAAGAVPPTSPTAREFKELPPGRYTVTLTGLISTVCARAIAAEWAKLPEVESATVDFDHASADLVVRLDKTVKTASLKKSLQRAERLANLGGQYAIWEITYRLGD